MYDLRDKRWLQNIRKKNNSHHTVVLTFDDGPSRHLEKLLDVLYEKQVRAVFFWNTRLLHKHRPWKRVLEEGHIIGSHAHRHKNLAALTKKEQYKQIKTSVKLIEEVTGTPVSFFRPPFGQYNEKTMEVLRELNIKPVMWEVTSYDWEYKSVPKQIIPNVTNHIQDGSIILLHELEQTAAILPSLIDEIRHQGYSFDVL
ncbi:polysaccharide deacetylase family protein [Alteribacillus persepolensis]|uniref:polysaccharide deacetylase family protein n=1 Tax=Alteribacillus persepolensis TaxID=568899 RepID=UPI000B8A5BB0|nr:polysaccharide deacetylase family protein [Alteribacillus persepolensis]